ncbi:MAG: YbhB/YbcL family Raf kinase inhibitor-like protein [Chloroflexota bacterium]
MSFSLTSTAFAEGGAIPRIHTCDGDDVSPPLAWAGAPEGTVSLALKVEDPDARGFIHWLAYAIDPASGSLPEGVSGVEGGLAEGFNNFGNVGYGGPCPPSGTHRYVFRLVALDVNPTFSGPPEGGALDAAIAGHVIGQTTLTGTYRRG